MHTPLPWHLRSKAFFNKLQYPLRTKIRWSRDNYQERPAGTLRGLTDWQRTELDRLAVRYHVCFESKLDRGNALENYQLLHLLDYCFEAFHWTPPQNARVLDVGSRNFSYASALHAFFQPQRLTGIEIDAYALYQNLHTRYSYAQHYIQDLPNTFYVVDDFLQFAGTADVIVMSYPYVLIGPLLHDQLPDKLFQPSALMSKAYRSLHADGHMVMRNQGFAEWTAAKTIANKVGFHCMGYDNVGTSLIDYETAPIMSVWKKTS